MALSDALQRLASSSARYYVGRKIMVRFKRYSMALVLMVAALGFTFLSVFLFLLALLFQLAQVTNWVVPFLIVGIVSLLVAALAAIQGSWLFRR